MTSSEPPLLTCAVRGKPRDVIAYLIAIAHPHPRDYLPASSPMSQMNADKHPYVVQTHAETEPRALCPIHISKSIDEPAPRCAPVLPARIPDDICHSHIPDRIEPIKTPSPSWHPCLLTMRFAAHTACPCAPPGTPDRNTVARIDRTCTVPSSCTPSTACGVGPCSPVQPLSDTSLCRAEDSRGPDSRR